MVGSLSSAMVCPYSREMGTRVNPHVNMIYFGAFIILCSPAAVHFTTQADGSGSMASIVGWLEFKLFLVVSAIGWISQVLWNVALTLETASRTQPLNYLQVVFAFVFDVTVFG